jgi:HSP20 family molecular chaperone IbpA
MEEVMERCHDAQILPVKMYETAERLMVAAPMPGLEPDDICIEVTPGNQLVLYGSARGSLKGEKARALAVARSGRADSRAPLRP